MARPKKAISTDLHRPLIIPIGGVISLNKKKFLGLKEKKIPLKYPGKENTLKAYGHMHRFGDNSNLFNQHRYYLHGDACLNGRFEESFLQISVDDKNQIKDCYLYRIFDEVFPYCDHEWDVWLDTDHGLLGAQDYSHENINISFQRCWEQEASKRVIPWFYEEFQWTKDESIGNTLRSHMIASQCMFYHHVLDGLSPKIDLALFVAVEEHFQDTSVKSYLGLKLDHNKDLKCL